MYAKPNLTYRLDLLLNSQSVNECHSDSCNVCQYYYITIKPCIYTTVQPTGLPDGTIKSMAVV